MHGALLQARLRFLHLSNSFRQKDFIHAAVPVVEKGREEVQSTKLVYSIFT